MFQRCFDIIISLIVLAIVAPVLVPTVIAVWLYDFRLPFYIAPRVGKNGNIFKMVKLRSMVLNADRSGVDSTSKQDPRITPVGHFVRRYKLDELCQLWNVLKGDMSLVGPRPNVERETNLYTNEEKKLLDVKPGITDIASIVFSDEGEILKDSQDPDLHYNQVIRPWKSRLGLLYIKNRSNALDIKLIMLTALTLVSKSAALRHIQNLLSKLGANQLLLEVVRRDKTLTPYPPPGSNEIVVSRAPL